MTTSELGKNVLSEAAAWRLLRTTGIGRIALRVDEGIDLFPINYLVHNNAIYFRSGPGSKMIDLTAAPAVAFETDGKRRRKIWSVVIRGTARRLSSDAEIEECGIMDLRTWHPSDKFNYVRIQPDTVSGRSFSRTPRS